MPRDTAEPDTAEASADDNLQTEEVPPLPKSRAKPAAQTESDDEGDAAVENEGSIEDEDLADLEHDTEDEEGEDGEFSASTKDDEADESNDPDLAPSQAADRSKPEDAAGNDAVDEVAPRQPEPAANPVDTLVEIEPAVLAALLEKGVIEVPARRSKLIHFVAVRKGRYHVSTLSFLDDLHWMKGTIIIE